MKVLVTGADGYIGAILGPYLLARGIDAVGLDTGFYRSLPGFPLPVQENYFLFFIIFLVYVFFFLFFMPKPYLLLKAPNIR